MSLAPFLSIVAIFARRLANIDKNPSLCQSWKGSFFIPSVTSLYFSDVDYT